MLRWCGTLYPSTVDRQSQYVYTFKRIFKTLIYFLLHTRRLPSHRHFTPLIRFVTWTSQQYCIVCNTLESDKQVERNDQARVHKHTSKGRAYQTRGFQTEL